MYVIWIICKRVQDPIQGKSPKVLKYRRFTNLALSYDLCQIVPCVEEWQDVVTSLNEQRG